MRAYFDKNAKRLAAGGFGFFAPAAVLVALLFGEAVASEEAYAGIGEAVALLSILGCAAGYLTFFTFRLQTGDHGLWTAIRAFSGDSSFDAASRPGKNWPVLITLLFGDIPILFAGLAGWVEARA
ncbi:MAG: hypothetical protein H0U65_00800 [Rubrobacter sp.]|nr:hypothetical protein [Rubrobacter sp.]